MAQMSLGKKAPPPGTAPKPGRGGYGDDFPAPPPELMNQYQQQQRGPGNNRLIQYGCLVFCIIFHVVCFCMSRYFCTDFAIDLPVLHYWV